MKWQEIRELVQARHGLYQEVSDYRVDTAGMTIEQVADQIIELLPGNAPS